MIKVIRYSDNKEGNIVNIDRVCSKTLQYQVQYPDEIRWQSIGEFSCDIDSSELMALPSGRV